MATKHVLVRVKEIAEELVDIIQKFPYEQSYTYDLVISGLNLLESKRQELENNFRSYKALEYKNNTNSRSILGGDN